MKATLITIGDEILIGQVVDSNSAWVARELTAIGFNVYQIRAVSDDYDEIMTALKEGEEKSDLVITTGGLGPTKDDITKQCFADYFGTGLVQNGEILEVIDKYFQKRGIQMPKANREQALVPETCTPIKNFNGTAPAMWFEKGEKAFISLPGVPHEMKTMMVDELLPMVQKKFIRRLADKIFHKTVWTQGIGESSLMEIIEDWENSLEEEKIKLAYLPQTGMVRLRLTATGENPDLIKQRVQKKINELEKIIPDYVWGYDDDKLEEVVGQLLKKRGLTLAAAESCTGGYVAHLITSVSGSSDYFNGAVVSYSNEVKVNALDVPEKQIEEKGAVSEEVVRAMAEGVCKKLNTGCAIATSGIAGPLGGTKEKPVGTVWIAVKTPRRTIAGKFSFGENRERNIRKSALQGLNMLRKELADYETTV